jgi:hypothetical protein
MSVSLPLGTPSILHALIDKTRQEIKTKPTLVIRKSKNSSHCMKCGEALEAGTVYVQKIKPHHYKHKHVHIE